MRYQRTIRKSVDLVGVGLHSGKQVHVRICPAPIDTGITFIRTDLGDLSIPAHVSLVSPERSVLSTTLVRGTASIQTIEHLMSAINGFYLDNLRIELNGPELPILDGSASPFVQAFRDAGVKEQHCRQSFYTVSKVVEFEEGNKFIRVEPSRELAVSYKIEFGPKINQHMEFSLSKHGFESAIAQAKTFCFLEDIEKMRSLGLVKGGTLENALVIGNDGVINPEYQTYPDEFVRHKILDFLGDIRLLDRPIVGNFIVSRGGHSFHTRFLLFLLEENLLTLVKSPESEPVWAGLACPVPV
ncbi:MAG: UDP-3-O-acyl-N-acetylglucosamine deacetylase [Leptospirales bacterium]